MSYYFDSPVSQNRLNLKLRPVFVGQLIILESLHHPAFMYEEGIFKTILEKDEGITSQFIRDYALNHSKEIYLFNEDYRILNEKLREDLTKLTRSLSIGNVLKNANRHVNLLTMQMEHLYKDPFNDELLNNQFQNSKNLSTLLLANKDIHSQIYHSLNKQSYHYTHKQPLLSSILSLSFIQSLGLFSEKEIQELFLASYFKDIGMSFIPREKFEQAHLSDFDKELFAEHAENSMKILEGRVPLSQSNLNLIKNHHYLNYKIQSIVYKTEIPQHIEFLSGLESALVSAIDILVAMTNDRPYRQSVSYFKALELLKKVLADDYPQEFKALVVFLRNFFSK
jgi:HD-GYP domain-containing protein (c-di-GMP phosphodiesterase class II)